MRTPTLQYLYLQKPVTLIIVICIIAVIPWIGLGDFSTKGEPREAAVAISMLESGRRYHLLRFQRRRAGSQIVHRKSCSKNPYAPEYCWQRSRNSGLVGK